VVCHLWEELSSLLASLGCLIYPFHQLQDRDNCIAHVDDDAILAKIEDEIDRGQRVLVLFEGFDIC
jgi:hypothetical protein